MRWFWISALSLTAMLGASSVLHAQGAGAPSIWDGLYTPAQADRGKDVYASQCARCHADNLDGNDVAPPVKGGNFMTNWDGQTLADLVQRIRNTMPLDNPGSLSGASTTDLVAYLLQQNGAPAGAADLTSDSSAQSVIRITAGPPAHASLAPAAPAPVNGPFKVYARVR